MKQLFSFLLLALISIPFSIGQRSTLSGTISGAEPGTPLILCEAQGGRLIPTDTITPDRRGNFRLHRQGDTPQFFALALANEKGPIIHILLLPKEKANLTLLYEQDLNTIRIIEVSGSGNMDVYRRFNNLIIDAAVEESLQQSLPAQIASLVEENADKLISAFLVTYFEQAFDHFAPLYKKVYDNLKGTYPTQEFVRHIENRLRTAVVPGMEAPDIALPDTSGVIRRLSDLRGQVVMIDFWASWCRPCRMENPNVVRLYNRYHKQGFEIFSVSLDNNRDKWLQAIEADGLSWPNHVSDLRGWSSAGGKLYGINSIPATVLVDRDGKIIARNLRGEQLEQKLNDIFSK